MSRKRDYYCAVCTLYRLRAVEFVRDAQAMALAAMPARWKWRVFYIMRPTGGWRRL